jgi:hypothetical protein
MLCVVLVQMLALVAILVGRLPKTEIAPDSLGLPPRAKVQNNT